VVSFKPRPLYPQGKGPWYPLDRSLGGPQSRSERGGEEKIVGIMTYTEINHQILQLFKILELYPP
jgi:hypothetical protein